MATGQLSVLPPEIRAIVWKFSLPDDVPEVCISQKPSILATSINPTLVVDTAFPALVHVCRETRYFVFNTKISGVSFRYSDLADCDTPFRPFRNELDTLFNAHGSGVNHISTNVDSGLETMAEVHGIDDLGALQEASELLYIGTDLSDLEHLAVRVPTRHILGVYLQELLHHSLPRLKDATFVTVQAAGTVRATGTVQASGIVQAASTGVRRLLPDFQPPKGRCKLHRFSTQEMEQLAIRTRQDDIRNMDDLISSVVLGSMRLREFLSATEAKYKSSLAEKIELEKEIASTNQEEVFPDILERIFGIQAQTFIEYQSGSWKRAITETQPPEQITHVSYVSLDRHVYPEAFVYRDGAYIPKREIPARYAAEGHMRLKEQYQELVELELIRQDAQEDSEDEEEEGDDEDDEDDDRDDEA